ncbi:MAG: NAD(P)/FAD-dependent oxidoreductase [Ignavibacteria bacterium]|nr:NAD(P)/FAD-dependent oxidoreductase [Ignavibacteria bacterium]
MKFDVIIIGAGAAGLMCAITAGKRGLKAAVIEHNNRPGRKILISGGGRCNFTNIHTSYANFISANPDFCRSALAGYTPDDFISLVKEHGISFFEKKLGQLFCRSSAKQIVDMLMRECTETSVTVRCGEKVISVKKDDKFSVITSAGDYEAGSLVIATGGKSISKAGATGFGYAIAKQFGHSVVDIRPGLVPLLLGDSDRRKFGALSGVSLSGKASVKGASFEESILFTHKGLSGPAILQVSSFVREGEKLKVELADRSILEKELAEMKSSKVQTANFLSAYLPQRLIPALLEDKICTMPMNRLTSVELRTIADCASGREFIISGNEGFEKAEVTCGGVDTAKISSKTMESRLVSGLYFIGEVVDVTGWLGGYNFQWAWASGFAAGNALRV